MCLCWLIAVWSLLLLLPANFSLPGILTACSGLGVRVLSGNCVAFVANRIIIGAGADSWVVIGSVEEIWRLASCQGCLLCNTRTWKCKNTLLKAGCHRRRVIILVLAPCLAPYVLLKHLHCHTFVFIDWHFGVHQLFSSYLRFSYIFA